MGIKGLWSVLTPYCEKKSLHEMSGETVAVDLAGWVCDSQHAVDPRTAHKLYLRNLFFRTNSLLLCSVRPVFVLEGDAPGLKRNEMARRKGGAAPDPVRRRFKGILNECSALLRCMGVICVRAAGEAEATCAALNAHGAVNAVISQDSDCFAYGALRVYRNFTISGGGNGGVVQGCVQCYDAERIAQDIDFGRNKMVALAALCGCDYGAGAVGASVATAVAFLRTVPDALIMQRLESWSQDPAPEQFTTAPAHRGDAAAKRRELTLRTRAISFSTAAGEPFPSPRLRAEFLSDVPPPSVPQTPPLPDLVGFVKLMRNKLEWSERYSVEKFLPLLTRAHLTTPTSTCLRPVRILAKRKPKGVPCLEVLWSSADSALDGLVPDDQLKEGESADDIWRTCERYDTLRLRYPDLVSEFESSASTRRRRAHAAAPVLRTDPLRRKHKAAELTTATREKKTRKLIRSLRESLRNMSLNDSKPFTGEQIVKDASDRRLTSDNIDPTDREDDFADDDLSNVIDDIVRSVRGPRATVLGRRAVRLVFADHARSSTPIPQAAQAHNSQRNV